MSTSWDDVLRDIRTDLASVLAPYQPNLPPNFPNLAPTAGMIPPTLVTSGHPTQYWLLERLENKYCQITIFVDKNKENDVPYLSVYNPTTNIVTTLTSQLVTYESSRARKTLTVQVWAFSQPTRDAIIQVLVGRFGDFFRVYDARDNTTTLLRYESTDYHDAEMNDSVFVAEVSLSADATFTTTVEVTTVESTSLGVTVNPPQ